MNTTKQEIIPTGLTKNYVPYWTVRQAIKEAVQNIAYGVIKSDSTYSIRWEDGYGYLEDNYIGFPKSMLYIGESEQRDDEEGLGNFGEGWKVFLLVMAREGRYHRVDTVGYSFWGEMVPTAHGTEVLQIVVEENDRLSGTKAIMEVDENTFNSAVQSFAIFAGIDKEYTQENCVIPGRYGELWVNGVLIEDENGEPPVDLHLSYNLTDRKLMNRDRTQVNFNEVINKIQIILSKLTNVSIIQELFEFHRINKEITKQDLLHGPKIISFSARDAWKQAIEEVYDAKIENIVIPSDYNSEVNTHAEYCGYTLIDIPVHWYASLEYGVGIKLAVEKIQEEPFMEDVERFTVEQIDNLHYAKKKMRKCFGLKSVEELPEIVVKKTISLGTDTKTQGMYSKKKGKVYLLQEVLDDRETLLSVLVHELVHWETGADDNTPSFTQGFQDVIVRLLTN